jgi:8-oxo-dGTP pyrophosphatase MutT (NUDIX family)
MSRSFEVTGKRKAYSSQWLAVHHYDIRRDGQPGTYDVVERPDSVTIVASTRDDMVLLLRQYRFPTESYAWEVPMGAMEPGEEPEQAARRELREETGLTDLPLTRVGSFRPIPGLTPQRTTIFRATIPDSQVSALMDFPDNVDEIVSRQLIGPDQIDTMVARGEISDAFTLCSLALAGRLRPQKA